MKITENEKMLLEVARKLPADLLSQVVFLGGAVVGCLLTDEGAGEVRSTQDVDMVVGITSRSEFQRFERKLRKAGFSPSMEEGAPICRWQVGKVAVDIMPCSAEILGFSNKWYKATVENAETMTLEKTKIRIATAPYFLATKIEAFMGRGKDDFLGSSDMEDIVTLIDGRKELVEEIERAKPDLQKYLGSTFQKWLQRKVFLSCLAGHLAAGPASQDRKEEVQKRMKLISETG